MLPTADVRRWLLLLLSPLLSGAAAAPQSVRGLESPLASTGGMPRVHGGFPSFGMMS